MNTENIKVIIRKTPFINLYIWLKSLLVSPRSQSNEDKILSNLTNKYAIPHSFIEFGFGGWEFNCVGQANKWNGLLVDGDAYNIKIAKIILPNKIKTKHAWLTLENIDFIVEYGLERSLGILSIDIDGNDYWFLKKLIHLNPAVLIMKYNSSFGKKPITVPYDDKFIRFEKHNSGLYFGASLKAITLLANKHNYALVDISDSGVNAFYVRRDLMKDGDIELDPDIAFKVKYIANILNLDDQWEIIKSLEYIQCDEK